MFAEQEGDEIFNVGPSFFNVLKSNCLAMDS